MGPLGIRIEPLGKTSRQEAKAAFIAQIAALVEGGVDLLILETMGYLDELHQAILAAREVNAALPVVAQVTIDEDGNCLDGSSPETFAAKLTEWDADVVGCNCSVGPVAMLDAMERVRRVTTKPLVGAAQRRHAARGGRPQHLSLLAGIHGELHPQVSGGGRAIGGRLLRDHSRAHPRHEVGAAHGRCQRLGRAGGVGAQDGFCRQQPAPGEALTPGRQDRRRRICHHGGDRAAQGNQCCS